MIIWVDADACPAKVREILLKASARLSVGIKFVANSWLRLPKSPLVEMMVVAEGPDVADDKIAELSAAGDLVVTADIPLAARVLEKGAHVITPRGDKFDQDSIREKLVMRDFMDEMRGSGIDTGGPPPLGPKEINAFANQLDRLLTTLT